VHLVGFIIRIYHDARSPKRQIFAVCYNKSILSINAPKFLNSIRISGIL